MSTITVLHIDSPILERFTEAFGYAGTRYGVAHTVYSHSVQEVDPELVSISLRATTDEAGNTLPGADFDPETYEPQELSAEEFLDMIADVKNASYFPPAEPELFEERYQVKNIDPRDFRDYLESLGLLDKVYALARTMEEQGDDTGRKWIDHESAGTIKMTHHQLVDGMAKLVVAGVWTQAEHDLVAMGIPYSFLIKPSQ